MLVAAAGAGGVAIAIAVLAVIGVWYFFRPKPPKPWNTGALKATFSYVDTEGEGKSLVFYYLVENTTPVDYKVSSSSELSLAARLKQQKSLTMDREQKSLLLDYPIFVPAHERVLLAVHLPGYSYSSETAVDNAIRGTPKDPWEKYEVPPSPGLDTTEKHRENVKAYVGRILKNLDGFVLFDESRRYQIEFPRDWTSPP